MSDDIKITRERYSTDDGFEINSVHYESIDPILELIHANELEPHFVCCNRKISYKDALKNNYVFIEAMMHDTPLIIPATLIGVDDHVCCNLNDNDKHEIHYLDLHTNTLSCIDIELTQGLIYNEEISKQEQLEQIQDHIAKRTTLVDTLPHWNQKSILYSNAPEFMIKICTELELKDVYPSFESMQQHETVDVIRKKWLTKINQRAEEAAHTLELEKVQAEIEDDQTTIEEISVILGMLNELPLDAKIALNQFKDCSQICSYWPSLLLPGPDYMVPHDSYERYLLTGEYF